MALILCVPILCKFLGLFIQIAKHYHIGSNIEYAKQIFTHIENLKETHRIDLLLRE